MKQRLIDVAFDVRTAGSNAVYTYSAPEPVSLGSAVLAQVGPKVNIGYVVDLYEADPAEKGISPNRLRSVEIIDGMTIPPSLLSILRFMGEEYLCPLSVAVAPAFPPGVTNQLLTRWSYVQEPSPEQELTLLQKEALEALKQGPLLEGGSRKKLEGPTRKALSLLVTKGLASKVVTLHAADAKKRSSAVFRLSSYSDKIEAFLKKEGRKKPAQALTLMRMQAVGTIALSAGEIKALSGVTDQTINALLSAGLLESFDEVARVRSNPPTLNTEQAEAAKHLVDAIKDKRYESFLLFGVTGSGKTEVFLRAAAEALRSGRQVLYLVPEIALAAQAISQLRDRFGDRVAIVHSELSMGERIDTWSRIQRGEVAVVLGARSALFAPISNLGLIVIDEEHETSYKQESSPRYFTKTVALKLAQAHDAAIVLGSATPSIESFAEAQKGIHKLLTLTKRAAAANMPTVFIDDLSEGYRTSQPSILAPTLHGHLEEILAKKEQSILFLNRRAYAPFLLCRDCGKQFMCPRCSVALSYSRKEHKLRCHHCDHRENPPDECPQCAGHRLNPLGIGTEKVEEAVKEAFPTARVARLDRDVVRKKGALEETLANFRAGELDVLVGTQMVAKGLDFPKVTLVGVIAADVSLNLPDFRASERTYQLLSQVAGRAGRSTSPGHVVIQTFNPHHIAMECARDHDYLRLFNEIKAEREEVGYPPFKRLINVLVTGEKRQQVIDVSYQVAVALENQPGMEILGPTDAAIERIQNRWRRHVLIKLDPDFPVSEVGRRLEGIGEKDVTVIVDVDAYSMV